MPGLARGIACVATLLIPVAAGVTELKLTWSDCGSGADAKVTSITPAVLPLGATTAISGGGDLHKKFTGGTWSATMTGVGGVSLLKNCKGSDVTKSKTCDVGLGPVKIGTMTYGGVKMPKVPGHIDLPSLMSVTLPTGLPSFALSTTSTVIATDQDGVQAFCAKVNTAPADLATQDEDSWTTLAGTPEMLPAAVAPSTLFSQQDAWLLFDQMFKGSLPSVSSLTLTWKDCGSGADAKVTSITPASLPLGATTAVSGAGDLTKKITGGSFGMTMTGVGGVSLLKNCEGSDVTKSKTCNIGLGPVKIGTMIFGGVTMPKVPGHITLPNIVSITLPKGLPSFALKTTTTLTVKDQGGGQAFCAQIKTAPADLDASLLMV